MLELTLLLVAAIPASHVAPLNPTTPVEVAGGPGKFDFMNSDSKDRLVFACHPSKSTFTVVDLKSGAAKDVDAGVAVNGIDADSKRHTVYAAGPGKALVAFDMRTWTKTGSLTLDGPGDSVVCDPKAGLVYVDNDDGTSLWIVNADTLKILNTITIKEAPEVLVRDERRGKLFQNIKTTNSIQVVDCKEQKVVAEYTLGDLTSPHGLALDSNLGRLFSVGKNGKLVVLDADSGKILQTVDVNKNSDQIAYDPALKRLYIPGSGVIDVVQMGPEGGQVIGTVSVATGCHSITVDLKTHDVWVAYSSNSGSFVQKFMASA